MEKIYLSIVIPAFNEAKRIKKTLLSVDDYLKKQDFSYEILVVNDGSSDETAQVVKNLEGQINHLKLLDNQRNQGKGQVVKEGMLAAQGEYRLFMDADNSTTIDHLDKFWPFFKQGYGLVIGSIEVAGAKIKENSAWYRRWLGHLSKYVIRLIAGLWSIHDSQRGFKLFQGEIAQEIFKKQTIKRWGFDIEILVIAKKMGVKIKEVAVNWDNPAESKVKLISYFKTLLDLFKVKWNLIVGKYK